MQAWTSSSTYYLRLGENLGPQFLFPVFSFLFLSARAFACFGFATSLRWKFSRSNASLRLWVWFGTDRFVAGGHTLQCTFCCTCARRPPAC